jgi:hypothetical protein
MSGVREEFLDRQAEVLGLPAVKVMLPAACPKLYEQWMASIRAPEPGAGRRDSSPSRWLDPAGGSILPSQTRKSPTAGPGSTLRS